MLIPKSHRKSYRSELMEDLGENTKIAFLYFGKVGAYDILRIINSVLTRESVYSSPIEKLPFGK